MKVVVDAHPLVNSHSRRGIGRTTRRLLEEFARFPPGDPADIEIAYCLPAAQWEHPPELGRLRLLALEEGEDILDVAAREGADLLHIMDYFFPLYSPERFLSGGPLPFRLLVTVRDIIPFHFPQVKQKGLVKLERNLFPLLQRADHAIAISHWTRQDLVSSLNLPPERISVVHHGVDGSVFCEQPRSEVREVTRRYGLANPYVLYVSAFDVRKNHGLLVDAVHCLNRMRRGTFDLVLVGPGEPSRALSDLIAQRRMGGQVKILGLVPSADLVRLYAGAAVFAFPSVSEGFGNPVVEAMACGVPVVALRRSSVPEIAGDAALLVSKDECGAFAQALAEATTPALAAELGRRGKRRAAAFTWPASAEKTLAVYRQMACPSLTTTSV